MNRIATMELSTRRCAANQVFAFALRLIFAEPSGSRNAAGNAMAAFPDGNDWQSSQNALRKDHPHA
jgi:hypothetical protein